MPEFKEMLADRVKETEEIIKRYLPEEAGFQRTIMKAMNYSMNAGGKRIRPLLCWRPAGFSALAVPGKNWSISWRPLR